jgi:FkbM family methyltransferase
MAESFRSPRKIARRLKLLPLVRRKVKNWPAFMYNYALGLTPRSGYRFRNGAQIKIGRGIDHVPIIEIFLREDYGEMPDDAVIVDLGANIGVFTVYATTTARNATVYAYEPLQDFYNLMRENVRLNERGGTTVRCFNFAVAGQSETRTLFVKGTDFYFPTLVGKETGNGQQETIEVKCTTLRDIMESNHLEQIDMLKMDCEGAEYEILYPTPAALFPRIKEIRMEYHNLDDRERHLDRLKEFLAENGYTVTRIQATSETNGSLWAERR